MALRNVVFLRNKKSLCGVLESFADGLQEGFNRLGVATSSYDFDDFESGKCIPHIVASAPDCTIGFNIMLPEDSPLSQYNIPHYAPLCDSATYYPELRLTNHMLASFMDQDSYGFYKRLGVENIFFLPHAISEKYLVQKPQKRDLDVVMAGSFVNPDAIRKVWDEQLSPKSRDAMLEIAERVLASPHVSHLQAFTEEVEEHGPFEKELLAKKLDFFSQLNMLEVYIRNVDRLRLIQSIEGHTVHIFSANVFKQAWKKALGDKKNIAFHDEVSFDELAAIFARAKCVVNSIPTIKRGLHERLLLALGQGASVLGNENIFIAGQFAPSKALLNMLSPDYSQANDLLQDAFANEEARFADVVATHQTIKELHTWNVRAKTLANTLPVFLTRMKG